MAAHSTVTADWTFHNERRIAKPDVMLVSGALAASDPQLAEKKLPLEAPAQVAPSEDPSQVALGTCFCGNVKLELPLSLKPMTNVICHCTDCQEWLSTSSAALMLFPLEKSQQDGMHRIPLNITTPTTNLNHVQRSPEVRRYFATCCGTRLFNVTISPLRGFEICSTYPTLFPTYECQLTMHVCLRENKIVDRGLEMWMDLPAEFGGTGTKLE